MKPLAPTLTLQSSKRENPFSPPTQCFKFFNLQFRLQLGSKKSTRFFAKNSMHLWFEYPRFFVYNLMLVELNTFGFVIETQNGIIKPCVFVVRTKVCILKLPNSIFHHDDGKSSLHFFSSNMISKQQKNTTIFIFALTFVLKMACTKMDKNDFSPFFFSFNIYFLLFTFSVSCPMSLLFYYNNLQFMFFIFRFQKW